MSRRSRARAKRHADAPVQHHALWQKNARDAMKRYATDHGVECFVCHSLTNPWAKVGTTTRGIWGICVPCASKRNSRPA